MQTLLRGEGQTAFFRHRDEVSEMSQLHAKPSPKGMALTLQSLSPERQRHLIVLQQQQ
jgi:hypothetical protein